MKSYWKKRLTAIALVCLMVLMMVPETALSVYAADEDEILVGAEEIVEQDAEVPEEAVELPEISEVYPETLEGSEEEFVEEDAEEVIIEDAPVILEEEAEPEIQSEVPEIYDEEIEVADPTVVDGVEAEELVGASAATIVVKKEWSDGAEKHTHDTVTVSVKEGNTEKGPFTLSGSNGWQVSFAGNANTTYTVDETQITSNGQNVTEQYKRSISNQSEYVWVKKPIGSELIDGETYVFTYTDDSKTYAVGSQHNYFSLTPYTFNGSSDNLPTDGQSNESIDANHRWTIGKNNSRYNITNNQTTFDVEYTTEGYLRVHRRAATNWLVANDEEIDEHPTSLYGRTVFTPYLRTKVTTYTITNTPIVFHVYHTGTPGGKLDTIFIDSLNNNPYDLTLNLTENTLYGGYYLESGIKTKPAEGDAYDGSNWTFTTAEEVPGTAITPVAGTTYYVKEVPIQYLKPVNYILYDRNVKKATADGTQVCKGRLRKLFVMAAVDDEQYTSIGFDIDGGVGAGYHNQSVYSDFVVTRSGQPYQTYTASGLFGVQGNLAVADMSDQLQEDNEYTVTPYWITKDQIKVTSAYKYEMSIGDGYHYGWVSPGITKVLRWNDSTLTPQNRTLNTRKLTVSRYMFNEDEPNPTETVTPPVTVEPTTEPTTAPTETVEPEPTTVPTETVEPEPTAEPTVEPTMVPTETVEPVPTTAPTTPSSSSMNNTTPSGVIAKLLRMLGSLFK